MSLQKTSNVNSRLNIPISPGTRAELEEMAVSEGYSLAELGRQALKAFLTEHRHQVRLARLCHTASKYSDILGTVSENWRVTEVEGLTDE